MKRLAIVVKLSLFGLLVWGARASAQSPADLPGIWAVGQNQISPQLLQVTPPTPAPAELTLQDAVKLGLERNTGFRRTIQDLLDARSRYYVALQRWDLTLEGTAQRAHTDEGSTTTWSVGPVLNYSALTGADFSVSAELNRLDTDERTTTVTASFRQPLLAGAGKASPAYEEVRAARNSYRAALLSYFTDRQDLLVNTISSYFDAVQQQQLAAIQASSVRLAEAAVKDAEARLSAKLIIQLDLFRAQLRLSRSQQAQVLSQQEEQDALDRLLLLIGLEVGGQPQLVTTVSYRPVAVDLTAAAKQALERRPELRLAELTIENRVASVRINRSLRLPSVDVFGNYQRLKSDQVDDVSRGWTLGLDLSVPIASRSLREAVRQSQWALLVAQQELENQRQQVLFDVRSQARAAFAAQSNVDIAQQGLAVSQRSLQDATRIVEEGLGVNRDLLESQDELIASQVSLVQSRIGYYLATVRLRRAMGEDVAVGLPTERVTPGAPAIPEVVMPKPPGTPGVGPQGPGAGTTPATPGTEAAPVAPAAPGAGPAPEAPTGAAGETAPPPAGTEAAPAAPETAPTPGEPGAATPAPGTMPGTEAAPAGPAAPTSAVGQTGT